MAHAAIVARALTLEGRRRRRVLAAIGVHPISGTAHRLQRLAVERQIDPAPEMADVDLDDVRVAVEGLVPDVLDDLRLRADLTGVAHQVLEQRELPGAELDLDVAAETAMARRVEVEVAG